MKKNLYFFMSLLCLLLCGAAPTWAALTTTPISGDYLFIAQTAMGGNGVNSASNYDAYIKSYSTNNNAYASNRGSSTINGTSYYNCMQIKGERGVKFSVASPCTLTIYGQENSTRTFYVGTKDQGTEIATCASSGAPYTVEITSSFVNQDIYLSASSDLYLAGLEFTFPVTEAPSITTDVNSSYNVDTKTATNISVVATGASSYQWYTCDNTEKTNPAAIDGATTSTLSHKFTTAGTYYVYCVVTNTLGTATSSVATVNVTEAAKSTECNLTNIVLSNGFDMFIKDNVLTGYYLSGTSVPTVSSITLSEGATYTINGTTLTVTAEDGTTTKDYTYNVSAVEPLTSNDVQTLSEEVPSWLKGGAWSSSKSAHEIYKSVEEITNKRISEGKNRIYLFLGAGSAVRLTSNDSYSSARTVTVKRNGVALDSPSKMNNSKSEVVDIIADEANPCMIEIVNTNTSGSLGIAKVQLINYPYISFSVTDPEVSGKGIKTIQYKESTPYTLPSYYAYAKEGYTLTAWNDGTADYAPGTAYTFTGTEVTFTPVFTTNVTSLKENTTNVTVKWQFGKKNGAQVLAFQGGDYITPYAAKANIDGTATDIIMTMDARSGKVNNETRTDALAQTNNGTKLIVPVKNGSVITLKTYNTSAGTKIGDYTIVDGDVTGSKGNYVATYTYTGSSSEVEIALQGASYTEYVSVTYPAVPSIVADVNATVGYATFYSEYEVTIPASTKAYTGSLSVNTLTLTELEGEVIPARTAVVLTGVGGTFVPSATRATTANANNLQGTAVALATKDVTGGTVCVLGYENSTAGFYKYTGETLGANKAYLVVPDGAAAPKIQIVFDDEATAINGVQNNESEMKGETYNLAGQRVSSDFNGIVIKNGKKVLVK